MEGWLIFIGVVVAIWFIGWLNSRVSSYKKEEARKAEDEIRRAENAVIQEALNGFDVYVEKEKIIRLIKDTLPSGYRCSKSGCDGILLKQSNNNLYMCSECHNIRRVIRV